MIIYELVGWTAAIDWGDRSDRIHIGFYATMDGAERQMAAYKADKEFHMKWRTFTINSHEVQE